MTAKERYGQAVESFNRHDAKGFAAFYAADAVVDDPLYPQPLEGRDAIEQDAVDVLRAFPDARFALRAVLEAGGTTAVEYGLSGTHTAPSPHPMARFQPPARP